MLLHLTWLYFEQRVVKKINVLFVHRKLFIWITFFLDHYNMNQNPLYCLNKDSKISISDYIVHIVPLNEKYVVHSRKTFWVVILYDIQIMSYYSIIAQIFFHITKLLCFKSSDIIFENTNTIHYRTVNCKMHEISLPYIPRI